jgi:hypothetical protein
MLWNKKQAEEEEMHPEEKQDGLWMEESKDLMIKTTQQDANQFIVTKGSLIKSLEEISRETRHIKFKGSDYKETRKDRDTTGDNDGIDKRAKSIESLREINEKEEHPHRKLHDSEMKVEEALCIARWIEREKHAVREGNTQKSLLWNKIEEKVCRTSNLHPYCL